MGGIFASCLHTSGSLCCTVAIVTHRDYRMPCYSTKGGRGGGGRRTTN